MFTFIILSNITIYGQDKSYEVIYSIKINKEEMLNEIEKKVSNDRIKYLPVFSKMIDASNNTKFSLKIEDGISLFQPIASLKRGEENNSLKKRAFATIRPL